MNHDTAATVPPGLRCLLCGGSTFTTVWRLTGEDVRTLWKTRGLHLSEGAFGPLTPQRECAQFECCACGFRFFDPSLAGNGKFYEELEQRDYYVVTRPEFDFALQISRREHLKSVLDVGGGDGAFLDRARAAGLTTFAVELNAHAAEICARKGHQTLRKLLEDISPREVGGGVDILTLFQVIEHVPDPITFLRQAATLVRSGGIIVVAVPNNRGQHVVLPFDPANMPPHHVSRWRMRDLQQLGAKCGLRIVARGADILYGAGLAGFWLAHNRMAVAIGRSPHPGGEWLPKILSFVYRKLGCRYYFPRRGLSIYVAYRKP
jgi:2-polyprenyl-3-methyl-5-hydroxy-6-metoxy-1,4-benzoquinol methylase